MNSIRIALALISALVFPTVAAAQEREPGPDFQAALEHATDLRQAMREHQEAGRAEAARDSAVQLDAILKEFPAVAERLRDEERSGPEDVERRIHHLAEAAENLARAGFPDEAREMRRRAEAMEREFREHLEQQEEQRRNQGREPQARLDELEHRVRELGEAVERLQAENRELRELLDKRQP